MRLSAVILGVLLLAGPAQGAAPKVLDARYRLEQVAAEPDIVTPVGMTFDPRGRLLVIESHTHFRPRDYKGPPADRIRIVEDTNGDGRADRFSTFHEGTTATMSVAAHPGGWVYVATRMKVFRLRDRDGDGKADEEETLAHLETAGNYPHNGLCGLAFDGAGHLYFGMGENLGEPYRLVARDGTTLQGGGEGGNIYHCKADGTGLKRVATGLWNPFGICVDPRGRVFTVENDPDSCPPCRLLHVAHGGDYGFQFRYGRSGIHPLQAWDGELPGTLPMTAGTGEAPCTVLPYHGDLWVTSWGDHRIERYVLSPEGASWRGTLQTVVHGDETFRPVGMAVAPDGSLYFSDWVDRSYPLHGKGRIWRLVPTKAAPTGRQLPPLTEAEKEARQLESRPSQEALKSADPFLRQAAVWGLIAHGRPGDLDWKKLANARVRLGVLQALRWREERGDEVLPLALQDPDPAVRLLAVRWVADLRLTKYRDQVARQLERKDSTPALLKASVAAIPWLDSKTLVVGRKPAESEPLFLAILNDPNKPASLRTWALRSLPADHPALTPERLRSFLRSGSQDLQRETVWALAQLSRKEHLALLAEVAADEGRPAQMRADAVMGLGRSAAETEAVLRKLASSKNEVVRTEAQRSLRGIDGRLERLASAPRPAVEDVDAWLGHVGAGGDPEAGRRVFFGTAGPACARCHAFAGRGADVGPDLSWIGRQASRRRLLESILHPSREIGPLYRTWVVETSDGRTWTGNSLGTTDQGKKERFADAAGKVFTLTVKDIESRAASNMSIMPEGLWRLMTDAELRDLLAYLERGSAP